MFSNHYHFVGRTPEEDRAVAKLTRAVHQESARWINERHETPGRRVWYSSWDTLLTFERSYLARLAYVHKNAVRHGMVVSDLEIYNPLEEQNAMNYKSENAAIPPPFPT